MVFKHWCFSTSSFVKKKKKEISCQPCCLFWFIIGFIEVIIDNMVVVCKIDWLAYHVCLHKNENFCGTIFGSDRLWQPLKLCLIFKIFMLPSTRRFYCYQYIHTGTSEQVFHQHNSATIIWYAASPSWGVGCAAFMDAAPQGLVYWVLRHLWPMDTFFFVFSKSISSLVCSWGILRVWITLSWIEKCY